MINSFGTGKPTEAAESGSGRGKRRQLFGLFGCSAVRLFGLFGCSAVRLFGQRRRLSSPAWPAASAAKPHPKEAALLLCCSVVFLWARPSAVPAVA